jgi:hypothetical protein
MQTKLDHTQNPTLNGGDFSLLRRRWRVEVAAKRAIHIGALQPRRHGEGGLFITVLAFLREPPRPQRPETAFRKLAR